MSGQSSLPTGHETARKQGSTWEDAVTGQRAVHIHIYVSFSFPIYFDLSLFEELISLVVLIKFGFFACVQVSFGHLWEADYKGIIWMGPS